MTRRTRTAIHEAGHAVVAAYLRVAMSSVTIQADFAERERGHARFTSSGDLELMCWTAAGQCKLAMVNLAGRAAVELFCPGVRCSDGHYHSDELSVSQAWGVINSDEALKKFVAWRGLRLDKVREIVRLPYVRATIRVVAEDLLQSTTLPHKHVLRALRDCRFLLSPAA